jgi:hypothetical protein
VTLQDLANLGEFVSSVAVVCSLAYLAIQMRQNTEAIRADNYARALDRISAMQAKISGDRAFATLMSIGTTDPGQLSPVDRIRFTLLGYEMFGGFEFMFLQAKDGKLPDEVWKRWSATTAWWLALPGIRTWWAIRPAPFSESFTNFVDTCIRENWGDTAALQRWQEFVRSGIA